MNRLALLLNPIECPTRSHIKGSLTHATEMLMDDAIKYKTDKSVYTPSDFMQWKESKTIELSPKFQRREVWKTPAKSFFIDTLLRGMPVPPIYLRLAQPEGEIKTIREVVDGQQRVRAVMAYIDGEYRLSKTLDADWKGKHFNQLTVSQQRRIYKSTFPTEIFQEIPDADVLNVFARLNTHGIKLNEQELRNGRFFGVFKQTAYRLAYEHLEFWRRNGIFTEQAIARMLEVELTSELLIAAAKGMQDTKKNISSFYKDWNEDYPNRIREEKRLSEVLAEIGEIHGDNLKDTQFHRVPLFYTLYCVVFHHMYGLPGQSKASPKKKLPKASRQDLKDAVLRLSDVLSEYRGNPEKAPRKYTAFFTASTGDTVSLAPRQTRFDVLYREAF